MKKYLLLLAVFCLIGNLSAQSVQEQMISINKQNLSGFSLKLPNLNPKVVEGALSQKMQKQMGLSSSKFGDFVAYLNQPVPNFGTLNYDVYTKVAEVGKKKDKVTEVYFFVAKGNLNPVTDYNEIRNIKQFLSEFVDFAKAHNAQNQIDIYAAELKKLEKDQSKLQSEKKKLEKKVNGVNENISKKESDISKIKIEIEKTKELFKQFSK